MEQSGPQVASILLVDDQLANLTALEAVLSPHGFRLVSVRSGREALRELLRDRFALVILDVRMPGLDGFETAALMRKRERNATTPIIFLTALYSDPAQAALGYAAGAVDYICKPFDPAFLLAKVQVFADLYLANESLRVQADLLATTDRDLLESRHMVQAHKQAAELAGAKGAFLASISHELRTPLHSLIGWTKMLRSGVLTEEKRETALAVIERNVRLQVRLVDDLIDVAHLVGGTLALDLEDLDLAALVSSEVEAARAGFPGRHVRLQQDSAKVSIRGDPARLRQAVCHILKNALKFSEPHGRVDVSISRAGGRASVTVRDSGEGISPEFLSHIFEPFSAEKAVEKTRPGLAIGLALAKNVALLHGGDLTAESAGKGGGAILTLELPMAAKAAKIALMVAPSAAPAPRASVKRPLSNVRILVVEDDPDARELLCTLLESEGVLVTSAASAEEAMERFAETRPDILLSDIGLPGVDGCSLMRRVRALGPERGGSLPAVAITAYGSSEDVCRVLEAGFDKHLCKPAEPEEMLGTLIAMRKASGQQGGDVFHRARAARVEGSR
jgi:CheY-like chemotaxis protein/nitrogen-specific signal transduction histidine kinase